MSTDVSDDIRKAEQALERARSERQRVEDAILAGDRSVTPGDIIEADKAVAGAEAYLEVTREFVKRQREAERERARQERYDALDAEAPDKLRSSVETVVADFDAAVAALEPLVRHAVAHNETLEGIAKRARGSEGLVRSSGDYRAAVIVGRNSKSFHRAGFHHVDVHRLVAEAVHAALAKGGAPLHPSRGLPEFRVSDGIRKLHFDAPLAKLTE